MNINSIMGATLRQAQERMAEQVRKRDADTRAAAAAEERRKAETAASEAKRLEEAAKTAERELESKKLALAETQRINTLITNASQEVKGILTGTTNMEAIFNEKADVLDKFLNTNPLEDAIIANALGAVKILVNNGQRYDAWQDIVDENTPLYEYLSVKFMTSGPKFSA